MGGDHFAYFSQILSSVALNRNPVLATASDMSNNGRENTARAA